MLYVYGRSIYIYTYHCISWYSFAPILKSCRPSDITGLIASCWRWGDGTARSCLSTISYQAGSLCLWSQCEMIKNVWWKADQLVGNENEVIVLMQLMFQTVSDMISDLMISHVGCADNLPAFPPKAFQSWSLLFGESLPVQHLGLWQWPVIETLLTCSWYPLVI